MAKVTRLELATSGVTGQRSNQLSYTSLKNGVPFYKAQTSMVGDDRIELPTPSV